MSDLDDDDFFNNSESSDDDLELEMLNEPRVRNTNYLGNIYHNIFTYTKNNYLIFNFRRNSSAI